jgi:lysophospholipase L1-like esterase
MYWLQAFIILPRLFHKSNGLQTRSLNTSLRILPLGDSITFGTDSSDGNGYRLDLENLLEPSSTLQYIGSVRAGSMTDNYNEGHPGFTIDQIADEASRDSTLSPNVVLLMAGTNDVLQDLDLSKAPSRLGALITQLTTGLPTAVILVATLTPLLNTTLNSEVDGYNRAIPGLVATSTKAGKFVMTVSMSNVTTATGIDLADGIHPNDAGYQTMAEAWYSGIVEAAGKGWIKPPTNVANATLTNYASSALPTAPSDTARTKSSSSSLSALKPLLILFLVRLLGLFCT